MNPTAICIKGIPSIYIQSVIHKHHDEIMGIPTLEFIIKSPSLSALYPSSAFSIRKGRMGCPPTAICLILVVMFSSKKVVFYPSNPSEQNHIPILSRCLNHDPVRTSFVTGVHTVTMQCSVVVTMSAWHHELNWLASGPGPGYIA